MGGAPQQGPLGAELARPTMQNMGGGPQNISDPLAYGLDTVISALKALSREAKMIGDPTLSNEVDQIANRLTRRKLNRGKAFQNAAKQAANVMTSFSE